jgi:co-chaperonin GroES (HSP10)
VKLSGINYKPLPKMAELDPGIEALGFKLLVLCREIEEKSATGSIIIPKVEGNLQREEEAGSEGMVVSLGMQAGSERWPEGYVKPGDLILFARYSGKAAEFEGKDGRTYRIMNDEDVIGLRTPADADARKYYGQKGPKAA